MTNRGRASRWARTLSALGPLALVGAACSSASPDGALTSCKSPGADLMEYSACVQANCGSALSSTSSACPASYFDCYAACACSDTGCINACFAQADAPCKEAESGATACAMAADCLESPTGTSLPADAHPFSGTLPMRAPPTCTGTTYYMVAKLEQLCDGGRVYLLCLSGTFSEYACANPGSGWTPVAPT